MAHTVSYDEILEISKDGKVLLIDVREPNEIQETGLIPSSINIPMKIVYQELNQERETFLSKYNVEKPTKDSYIIITCRSGRRAEIVMKELENYGYNNCKYYLGSWLEWESKNIK